MKKHTTQVKFCGLTNLQDVQKCIDLGVDYIGFNFVPQSPRSISISQLRELGKACLGTATKSVAIVANPDQNLLIELINTNLIDYIQIHGEISGNLDFTLIKKTKPKIGLWKAFQVGYQAKENLQIDGISTSYPQLLHKLKNLSLYFVRFVLDSIKKEDLSSPVNSFEAVELFSQLSKKYELVLAGGLNESNLLDYLKSLKPKMIDLASGIETFPGKKDFTKMQKVLEITKLFDS